MDQIKMGAFLKELRKEKHLTQEDLAEELHVSNRTISRWETGTSLPDINMLVMLSDFFSRALFWGGFKDNDNDKNSGNAILMLIGLIFLILSPIFGQLMQLAISRKREFLADATSVEFTRNPEGLISALQKISGDPEQLETANNSTAHMYIVNPFRDKKGKKTSSIWSTHPSLEDRVDALRHIN